MKFRKIFLVLAAAFVCLSADAQLSFPRQDVNYNVRYQFGFIDVMIAKGTVSMQSDGGNFYGTLNGTSIPWEGHIICVSDTLQADMRFDGGRLCERVGYQSGWYRHPKEQLFNGDDYNPADPAIYKNIAGEGSYNASHDSMEAITVTSDMLGMYYLAKALDFDALKPGDVLEIPIDGQYSKMLMITYKGPGEYNIGGNNYQTYDCTFEYDYGGSMSGYPVDCRIDCDSRIPLQLSASLPLGKVEMIYSADY